MFQSGSIDSHECNFQEELSVRPTSDVIFDMAFLARAASAADCHRCSGSVLNAHAFLRDLKQSIDELPATI